MTIKAVIFDLDGTLIDSIEDIADCTNKILSDNGYSTHPVESYIQWIGNGARVLIEKAVPEVTDSKKIDQLLRDYLKLYTENYSIKTKVYPGISEFLDALTEKCIPISVLTNKPHSETIKIAELYLKKWPFQYIFGQREGIPKKPDPTVALKIADGLGIKPSETIFVGDSSTDIRTALAAGMLSVGVTWGYGTKESMTEAGAITLFDNTEELFELIK